MPPNTPHVVAAPVSAVLPPANPFLGLLPRELWQRVKDYFSYTAEFLPLAASSTQSTDVAIQSDSDFLIIAATRVVTDTGNTTFLASAPQLVTMIDSGSGRQLMDKAVHLENLAGDAGTPFYWPFPKLIRGGSVVTVRNQNLEAVARNVRITFHGFKVFAFSN